MTEPRAAVPEGLEATSPFELRVDQSKNVPDSDVRTALATGSMGFLHSFTTGSTVDGPGVRVVAWTAGCMWRCLYCHNPDTWTMANGMPVTIANATDELRKYRQGLKAMNGGFTLSGGEPLMQYRFAVNLLVAARGMGIHTTLDTNGYYGARLTDDELGLIDLVMLDLKTWDPERHKRLTGMDVAPTLEFARRLGARQRPMWVRYVLVPGLTDDADDIKRTATFAAGLGNVQRVDVLPFHQMGRFKWQKLGIPYTLEQTAAPSADLLQRTIAIFKNEGLQAF
jgi:pyruvate formate lyase activating enzyme